MRQKIYWAGWAFVMGFGVQAPAQTAVDLKTQSKNVDFSNASSTKPFKSGSVLPATCSSGEIFYDTAAAAGANVYGCTTSNTWSLEGGGGGGLLAEVSDFSVLRTNATTLSISSTCTVLTPCRSRFGSVTFQFTSGATATITAGSGTAYVFVSNAGALTVGHNMTVICSGGCASQSGVNAFPPDSVPLATWTATNGTWDTVGGADWRAFLSTKPVFPGSGMLRTESGGGAFLSVDSSQIGFRVAVPASGTTACTPGSWSTDGAFFYVCVATDTWGRAALAGF